MIEPHIARARVYNRFYDDASSREVSTLLTGAYARGSPVYRTVEKNVADTSPYVSRVATPGSALTAARTTAYTTAPTVHTPSARPMAAGTFVLYITSC